MSALEKFRSASAQRDKEHEQRRKEMEARHAQGKENMSGTIDLLAKKLNKEDVPANNIGSGNIAGAGVGSQGEPGVPKKRKKVIPFNTFRRTY
jgi:hypothetical protein